MSLNYRISKRKNTIHTKQPENYMMQSIHTGEVNLERIAYEISNESTLSDTDIIAVLHALGTKVQFHLAEGKVVNLENLGRFKVGFQAPAQSKPEQLSPTQIKKFYINYQPSLKLKKWLKAGLNVRKEK